MLKLFESTPGTAVLSLRTGGAIATVLAPIVNPNNLYIEGWYVEDGRDKEHLILLSNDIRDIIQQGFVINDHEVLSKRDELVRLNDILKLEFDLLGLRVKSESGTKYGKINDYAFETKNLFVQKLYVARPLVKDFAGGTLSIDRSQIIEVTNRQIIIEEPTEKSGARAISPSVAG
jgi:uncharacterized protein YrrD